jgi:hypothetical protein
VCVCVSVLRTYLPLGRFFQKEIRTGQPKRQGRQ